MRCADQSSRAAHVTPRVIENVVRHLPLWKVEFTQINAPKFPHLVDQLEFLADAVEDEPVVDAQQRADYPQPSPLGRRHPASFCAC
jgi:hypothetical protein